MKQRHRRKPEKIREIALERIEILFEQAALRFNKNPELSNRYVEIARKISMKYKVRMPSRLKRKFCRHCYKYLVPGISARVRITNHKLVYYCNSCRKYWRMPLSKKSGPGKTSSL